MGISIYSIKDKVKHIKVSGELYEKEEITQLIEILNCVEEGSLQITFVDASILPVQVIEKLVSIQKSRKCNVYVVKPYLYSYMYKLGIQCRLINKKANEQQNNLVKTSFSTLELDKLEIVNFLQKIYSKYGYDYTEYQIDSIIRRIKISMLRENEIDFCKFQEKVLEDYRIFEQLFLDFSINTTKFFRDPEVFAALKDKVFPHLSIYPHIRIWCVGCSTGEEPYSLAILLKEAGLLDKTQIYATDINPYVIEEAKNGLYSIREIEEGIRNYRRASGTDMLTNYFKLEEQYVKVNEDLKKNILFFQHSLLSNAIISEVQLVLCRNVLMYFNPSLQKDVIKDLCKSLDKCGFLVLEKSGGMIQNNGYEYFNKYDDLNKIYRRKE